MKKLNETTDSHDERLSTVIPFPKRVPGLTMQQAYEQEKEHQERLERIRDKIRKINRMIAESQGKTNG